MNKTIPTILSFLITILIPIFLLMLGVRILLTPAFPEVEYRMPGFPEDSYGFTQTERLEYSKIAIEYLVNDAGIEYLGALTFDDGTPLFNMRELSHMVDVKVLVKFGLRLWLRATGLLVLLTGWAVVDKRKQAFLLGAKRGGWLTLILTASLGILAAIDFTAFFTQFHHLFFEEDTWLFLYSDTLIRLFPMRFWRDAFLMEGIIVIGGGLALALGLKPKQG